MAKHKTSLQRIEPSSPELVDFYNAWRERTSTHHIIGFVRDAADELGTAIAFTYIPPQKKRQSVKNQHFILRVDEQGFIIHRVTQNSGAK